MAVSAAKLIVGQGGTVQYGTVGITSPTNATAAPGAGYNDVGYLDPDGVTIRVEGEISEQGVWQSKQPGRRDFVRQNINISGNLAEWNSNTVPAVFGGGTVTGGTAFAFPSDTAALNEFSPLVDVVDGTKKIRFVFARANQVEPVEAPFNRSSLAVLPFNFGILAPSAGGSPGSAFFDPAI